MAWIVTNLNSDLQKSSRFQKHQLGEFYIYFEFDNRFNEDKIFSSTEKATILVDGVLLNKTELFKQSNTNSLGDWFSTIYNCDADTNEIIAKLRGPFTGCIFSKCTNELLVFPNQTGDTAVFSYSSNNSFSASSDFNLLVNHLKECGINLQINPTAVNQLLSLGYLVEDNTIVKEIQRVMPGYVLKFGLSGIEINSYHRFTTNNKLNISIEKAIKLLDVGFKKAVQRCFDKDIEYGYEHLVDISGGLDSRMVNWVAKDLGYQYITNICYAKKGSVEEVYAADVSKALGNEFIFKYLDDLRFFYDIDQIVQMNYGMAIYTGITGGNRLLSDLSFEKFGLEHTGQIGGDGTLVSFCKDIEDIEIDLSPLVYSNLIKPSIMYSNRFENQDLFSLYYKAFMGTLSTNFTRRNYTEVVSPFFDVDFVELCLSFPLEYRINHKIYWAWIDKYYPEAGMLPSTRKRTNHRDFSSRNIIRKLVGKRKRGIIKILKKLNLAHLIQSSTTMNPVDFWYYSDSKLRDYFDTYFNEHISLYDDFPELKSMLEKLYRGERVNDKCLALTALSAYKLYVK